jgi:hypothetical protein
MSTVENVEGHNDVHSGRPTAGVDNVQEQEKLEVTLREMLENAARRPCGRQSPASSARRERRPYGRQSPQGALLGGHLFGLLYF